MITEQSFRELWEAHKERLIRISGCFPVRKINKYSENTVESQFDDFLKKFIVGFIKMGGSKIQDRIKTFNFTLPQVDSLTSADTGLPSDFIEGFRLGLYMFLNYKITQQSNSVFQMNRDKCNLPVFKEKNTIISSVINNPVTIIIGDTGCGKSTQIPQYLVSNGWSRIVCTQPRRLSTISLSERVSKEMYCEDTGDVGYQIRFESKGRGRKLKFVTEGVLLKQVQSDPLLKQYSMVIVDEVHERHITTDMLLGILKIIAKKRQDFRIVIMSATMDPQRFIEFFSSPLEVGSSERSLSVNVISIPGRTYPVTIHYCPPEVEGVGRRRGPREERENPLMISDGGINPAPYLHILKEIDAGLDANERGDVLIFVSGLQEINTLVSALSEFASTSGRWVLLRLHSTLQSSEQQLIFNPTQPGVRKCIISTNIAETSVTIPNVRYVIDSGKNKELTEPTLSGGTTVQLHECYISRSGARQRAGRAGRTGPGECYRLYGEDDYYEMIEYSVPEILRGNIDDSILLIQLFHSLGILPSSNASITSFPLLDYPSNGTIRTSLKRLIGFNALNRQNQITSLGCLLSHLPLPIAHGYFLILSSLFHYPYYGALLCGSLSFQSLFLNRPPQSSLEVNNRRSFDCPQGDLISNLFILLQFIQVSKKYHSTSKWCSNRMLSYSNLMNCMNIVTQLISLLSSTHLIQQQSSSLIEQENYEDRKRREIQREALLKKRRVEVLDIKHNDELQKESDFNYSIDTSSIEVPNPMEDMDENENEAILNMNTSNKRINMKEFYKILSSYNIHYDTSTLITNDNQLFFSFLLATIFYPNIAVSNRMNGIRPSNEWTFLTQSKEDHGIADVLIYPTSCVLGYYSAHPDKKNEYPLKDKLLVYEKILDTKKPYLTNITVLPLLPSLLLLAKEIDFDNDHHILFDKWIYITIDNSVSFSQICEILEASQLIRMDFRRLIRYHINSLHSLPFLNQLHVDLMKKSMEEEEEATDLTDPIDPTELPPKAITLLKEKIAVTGPLPSAEVIQKRIVEFMKMTIPCSIEDISVNKVKALFGLIPSCDDLIAEIKKQKKEVGSEDAIAALEKGMNEVKQEEEEEEFVDYSSRLGIADSLSSLDSFKRKGFQLSPWLWYGSLQTTALKATVENFPDLISYKMTVRWDCPICKQVLYVTKEELVQHLNECVKYYVCCYLQ